MSSGYECEKWLERPTVFFMSSATFGDLLRQAATIDNTANTTHSEQLYIIHFFQGRAKQIQYMRGSHAFSCAL